ncbi:hypothetical protein Taro_050287 [Colocasia esculenta]|uniref:Uncharacterized protein n=1 Tax=Colocasia esculenta TaxID=4460 RepID=A0A843XDC1_COLES|nr:hypothetical protein [Colocasia esculenta]
MAILGCLTGSGGRYLPLGRHRHVHEGEDCTTREKLHHEREAHEPRPPKGCLAVMVGEEGEEPQRFVVPVGHLSHPLFQQLLRRAEDEHGFQHQGPITIPCPATEFRSVLQGVVHHDGRHHRHFHLFSINKHLLNNLRQHLHGGGGGGGKKDQQSSTHTPKGCLAVMVGQDGEEQRRFVVPVAYLSHPRFLQLLKEAEDEYGFHHKGAITIPCHVAEASSTATFSPLFTMAAAAAAAASTTSTTTFDRHLLNSILRHHHLHSGGGGSKREQLQQHHPQTPKGCLAVMVGREGEERQRFVVPVAYLSHPRFLRLLKEAEDEYGFDHQGAIAIPCHVADFCAVRGLIERELYSSSPHAGSGGGGGSHYHHLHHLHHNLVGCFRA